MNIREYKVVVAVLLLISILVGCGGGGGGSDAPAQNDLNVSQKSATPGTFITIEDSSIKNGSDLNVTFRDPSGFEVTLRSLFVEDGRAKIPVPPYTNKETGDFEVGDVTILLENGKQAAFQIKVLPDLEGLKAGFVVKAYLGVMLDNFQTHLDGMADFEREYGYDAEEMKAQLQMQIDEINRVLNELDSIELTPNYVVDFGKTTLSENELKKVDQLLYAMLLGISYESGYEGPTLRPLYQLSRQDSGYVRQLEENAKQMVEFCRNLGRRLSDFPRDAANSIKINSNAVEAQLRALAGKSGWAGKSLYAKFADPSVAFYKMLLQQMASLAASGNEFVRDGEWNGAEETRGLAREAYNAVRPEILEETEDYYNKLAPIVKWTLENKCKIGIGDYSFFCDNREKSRLQISTARFEQEVIKSGETAYLNFNIKEYLVSLNYAKNSRIHVSWGDGESSALEWGKFYKHKSTVGKGQLEHRYYLRDGEQSRTYTAHITVSGDNDFNYKHFLLVDIKVVDSIDSLSVTFLESESDLGINEKGWWKVEVSGGVPPFGVEMSWDDGKVQKRSDSPIRRYQGPHSYGNEGLYEIGFEVVDSKGNFAWNSTFVTVAEYREFIWKSTDTCPGVSDQNYAQKWSVTLKQDASGVTGNIYFHACPGEGRVSYTLSGPVSEDGTVFNLTGIKSGGRGGLYSTAPNSQQFTLTKDRAPVPNFASSEEITVEPTVWYYAGTATYRSTLTERDNESNTKTCESTGTWSLRLTAGGGARIIISPRPIIAYAKSWINDGAVYCTNPSTYDVELWNGTHDDTRFSVPASNAIWMDGDTHITGIFSENSAQGSYSHSRAVRLGDNDYHVSASLELSMTRDPTRGY